MNWSDKSLDELEQLYWDEMAPERRADGYDPDTDIPTYQWLNKNGYSGIHYTLREHHGMTTQEFFEQVLDFETSAEYTWPGENPRTQKALEDYLETLSTRQDLAESTVDSRRSRLATVYEKYIDIHGEDDLLAIARGDEQAARTMQRFVAVFDKLSEQLDTEPTRYRYLKNIDNFYDHALRWRKVDFNPIGPLKDEYNWSYANQNRDPAALEFEDVRALWNEARNLREEVLVYMYTGLGLRTSEPERVTYRHIQASGEFPEIQFEERKNGPSNVKILVGEDLLTTWLKHLRKNTQWSGALFPDQDGAPLSQRTMRRRFKKIADRAGVTVAGETPTPKHARRFWYNSYVKSEERLLEKADHAAEDQGSRDPETVQDNYLQKDTEWESHSKYIGEVLREAFPGIERECDQSLQTVLKQLRNRRTPGESFQSSFDEFDGGEADD